MITLAWLAAAFSQLPVGGSYESLHQILGSTYEFHTSLSGGRDLDGDGYGDFVFGRISPASVSAHSGRTGAQLWQAGISQSPQGLQLLPDVNGDLRADVVVANSPANSVSLLSGADGSLLWTAVGGTSVSGLGLCISSTADLDGDRLPEVVALAPWGTGRGTYLLSGADGTTILSVPHLVIWSSSTWGRRVSGVGDSDLDGYDDFLVGMVHTAGGPGTHLYSGRDGSLLRTYFMPEDFFGSTVARAGDLDHDGVPDHLVAARGAGKVHAYSGQTGLPLWECRGPPSVTSSWFGTGLADGDDLDGDGSADVLVGAPDHRNDLADYKGALFVVSGASGSLLAELRSSTHANIGDLVETLGDVSGDRIPELLMLGRSNSYPSMTDAVVEVGSWHCGLHASRDRVSARAGGLLRFDLSFPTTRAGNRYVIAASASGSGPSLWQDIPVPLTRDVLALRSYLSPLFAGAHGALDSMGDRTVNVSFPPGFLTPWLGSTFWFAALTEDPARLPASSIVRSVTILP